MSIFCINEHGIRVMVEGAKCVQASAFIQTGIFHEFSAKDDATFGINLNILLVDT